MQRLYFQDSCSDVVSYLQPFPLFLVKRCKTNLYDLSNELPLFPYFRMKVTGALLQFRGTWSSAKLLLIILSKNGISSVQSLCKMVGYMPSTPCDLNGPKFLIIHFIQIGEKMFLANAQFSLIACLVCLHSLPQSYLLGNMSPVAEGGIEFCSQCSSHLAWGECQVLEPCLLQLACTTSLLQGYSWSPYNIFWPLEFPYLLVLMG